MPNYPQTNECFFFFYSQLFFTIVDDSWNSFMLLVETHTRDLKIPPQQNLRMSGYDSQDKDNDLFYQYHSPLDSAELQHASRLVDRHLNTLDSLAAFRTINLTIPTTSGSTVTTRLNEVVYIRLKAMDQDTYLREVRKWPMEGWLAGWLDSSFGDFYDFIS